MRIPVRERSAGLPFSLTPLIDVVLQLIIFFLAASHLVRSESLRPVQLPTVAQPSQQTDESPRRLVVTITADAALFVADRQVSLDEVKQMIAAGQAEAPELFEVRIRVDRTVTYQHIEPLLLACAEAGVRRLGFAVLPQ